MLKYKIPQIVTLTPDCYVDPQVTLLVAGQRNNLGSAEIR